MQPRDRFSAGSSRQRWRALALAPLLLASTVAWRPNPAADEQTVRIGVLALFRPSELRLSAEAASRLEVEIGGQTRRLAGSDAPIAIRLADPGLEAQFGGGFAALSGKELLARTKSAGSGEVSGAFWLEVPGKLKRRYTGSLAIRRRGNALEAIVSMPLEVAVASVVAAESPPGAGMEALKAQAVAARSFFAARQAGHSDFDFCDTTHCQFLRSPPEPGSPASEAARATRGLVLTWHDQRAAQDRTLAAMYARSCGGRTRTLREIGLSIGGYPYYAVACDYCSRHPGAWQRDARAAPQTERQRLAFNRIHGWGALPSLPQGSADEGGAVHGQGVGHGIGMCQLGAADMARKGTKFAEILAHYYPNTRLAAIPEP